MKGKSIILTCDDKQRVAGYFYECDTPHGTVIISSALGVSQSYYKHFAEYMVDQGYNALTFDYRFTGDSFCIDDTDNNKCRQFDLIDWGSKDIEAAILFAHEKGLPIYFIGHSIGGQLVGMAPSAIKLSKLVFVSSSAPYWCRWTFPSNLKVALATAVILPTYTFFCKQFPCKKFGLGNLNIPSALIRQWASWLLYPDYLFDRKLGYDTGNYANLRQDILSLGFRDDEMAPEANLSHLLTFFPNAGSELKMFSPKDVGMTSLGHTGYFREAAKEPFWHQLVEWLKQ